MNLASLSCCDGFSKVGRTKGYDLLAHADCEALKDEKQQEKLSGFTT